MELTVETLRDAEFREGWRGYNPADVDEFIDRVSVGVQALHDRIHELTVRADRAESRLGGENDDTVKRTLVLAQRAADLVVSEAKSVAERIVQDAHREAERLHADAELEAKGKREQAEHELTRFTTERYAAADADHQRLLGQFSAEADNAKRDARVATARASELGVQAAALRDRFRAALSDQLARLDHLVDAVTPESTTVAGSRFSNQAVAEDRPSAAAATVDGSFDTSGDSSFAARPSTEIFTSSAVIPPLPGAHASRAVSSSSDDLPVFGGGRHLAPGSGAGSETSSADDFMA